MTASLRVTLIREDGSEDVYEGIGTVNHFNDIAHLDGVLHTNVDTLVAEVQ